MMQAFTINYFLIILFLYNAMPPKESLYKMTVIQELVAFRSLFHFSHGNAIKGSGHYW